jgi:hypothetical protein
MWCDAPDCAIFFARLSRAENRAVELSKAELARGLGVSKARISQYAALGMPFLPSGRITRADAERWLAANLDQSRVRFRSDQAPAASDALAADGAVGYVAAALAAIYAAGPLAVLAVAEAGGTREVAERAAAVMQATIWEAMNQSAAAAGVTLDGDGIAASLPRLDAAMQGVNWATAFTPDGASAITGSCQPS